MKYLFLLFLALLFVQCDDELAEDRIIFGLSPRYMILMEGQEVSAEAMPYDELVNFIIYGDYLLLVERGQGVHIINNQNPNNPINIAFIKMPGTVGVVAVNDNIIISLANYLVTVDISDFMNAFIVNILEIENSAQGEGLFPLNHDGYFECVDPSQGVVYKWVAQLLTNPKCRTIG